MAHTRIDDSDATITQGSGSPTTITNAAAYSGSYRRYTGIGGGVARIAVPSGKTSMVVMSVNNYEPTPGVRPLGSVWFSTDTAHVFPTDALTTDGTAVTAFKTSYPPFLLDGTAQTVSLVSNVLLTGVPVIDAVDYYVADTPTAGRVTVFGDALAAGSGLGSPSTQRFGAIMAAALGASYTEDNQATVGETFSQGADVTSANGNTIINQAGWRRVEAHTAWADRIPEVAVFCESYNDVRGRGLNDPSGGSNYGVERYKQRLRDAIYRMNCNCPNTLIIVCGVPYVSVNANTSSGYNISSGEFSHGSQAAGRIWTEEIGQVTCEPWCTNAYFLDIASVIANNGGDNLLINPVTDAWLPNAAGHSYLGLEMAKLVVKLQHRSAGFMNTGII